MFSIHQPYSEFIKFSFQFTSNPLKNLWKRVGNSNFHFALVQSRKNFRFWKNSTVTDLTNDHYFASLAKNYTKFTQCGIKTITLSFLKIPSLLLSVSKKVKGENTKAGNVSSKKEQILSIVKTGNMSMQRRSMFFWNQCKIHLFPFTIGWSIILYRANV